MGTPDGDGQGCLHDVGFVQVPPDVGLVFAANHAKNHGQKHPHYKIPIKEAELLYDRKRGARGARSLGRGGRRLSCAFIKSATD